jgi:hypothetical protein
LRNALYLEIFHACGPLLPAFQRFGVGARKNRVGRSRLGEFQGIELSSPPVPFIRDTARHENGASGWGAVSETA